MRPATEVREAFRLRRELGWGAPRIAAATGVSATQVGRWLRAGEAITLASLMRRDHHPPGACPWMSGLDEPAYAYLLGQYLGDGSIVRVQRTERLEICTTASYDGIRCEVHDAMTRVGGRRTHERQAPGSVVVASYCIHWPCLFPQHGPGRKHHRPIVLEPWQQELAIERHAGRLLRGLIHSDGWRGSNSVQRRGRRYAYVRYAFSNRSDDIHTTFTSACDRLGIAWRRGGPSVVYVSRGEAVRALDVHVGPKA